MGLFSQAQLSQINAAAEKSKQVFAQPKKSVAKSVNSELNQISQSVQEYFKDSKAILISSEDQLADYVDHIIVA